MIAGLSGSLLSHDALLARATIGPPAPTTSTRPRLLAWHAAWIRDLGPASGVRAVFDRVAAPLVSELGFQISPSPLGPGDALGAVLHAGGAASAGLLVLGWGGEPGAAWREGVRLGIGHGVRWCFCINGRALRVVDARRTWSRRFAEFDLAATLESAASFDIFWRLLHAGAFAGAPVPALDEAVAASDSHRASVRASLQRGVRDALVCLLDALVRTRRGRKAPPQALFDDALTVVYRVLFLLFAEARGLVPAWHPTYHDSYTLESLRCQIERSPKSPGVWESLQAIARLAHRGCHAGSLDVTPFNGRLFSPLHAPLADNAVLDDGRVRAALLALTTRPEGGARRRISYADLGVEQLGGVYERVLELEPERHDGPPPSVRLVSGGKRKAAGAFYTPRSLTEYLVRRTLAPLVRDAPADQVLALRVLDPSMGSGAFLVAACRYLAGAYEAALIRDGSAASSDLSDADRAAFRRAVAQRCLFGVDVNPMAVQLGRLSLWLATLSADRPLTFLDHHLRVGNSLSGASLHDVASRLPTGRLRRSRISALPLFGDADADAAVGAAAATRTAIAIDPGETIGQVREKERLLASLAEGAASLTRWKAAADLWCAAWLRDTTSGSARGAGGSFGALLDEILGRPRVLPAHVSAPLLDAARIAADRERFFHWTLEYPEVFYEDNGRPLGDPGFDAVLTNPPWEMLRGIRPGHEGAGLAAFTRASGIYTLQGDGHTNLFQLFLERGLSLVRRGGRFGFVVPAGLATDHGCAALRRHLLDRTTVDTFMSLENHNGLFPIHRALKFLLLAGSADGSTASLPCRFGVRSADILDDLPDLGPDPAAVAISRALVNHLSGDQAAIPELRGPADVALVSKIAFSIPMLKDPAGWNVSFGRELNATEDRVHFFDRASRIRPGATRRDPSAYPVIEGKHLRPFGVDLKASNLCIAARTAAQLLDGRATFDHPRLAYRDVASSTNRLTLIAAVVPARVVTTHTLFCLKGAPAPAVHYFLCAVFNSYVANYLVRLRVGLHVTTSIIECLPVPFLSQDAEAFRALAALSKSASQTSAAELESILQGRVARLYGLTAQDFALVLASLPLVAPAERDAAMAAFLDGR